MNSPSLEDLQAFYDALHENAELDTDANIMMFEGHTYKLFASMTPRRPQPYYSKLRRWLIAMQCVTPMQRGSRHQKSVWALHQRPTEAMMELVDGAAVMAPGTKEAIARSAVQRQKIDDILERIGGLNVTNVLRNFENRITALEDAVKELQNDKQE